MKTSPRHLQVLKGGSAPTPPSADQLDFGQANHWHPLARQRVIVEAVEADPRYSARHLAMAFWLTNYAGDDGIAQISLAQYARDRGRDPSNIRRLVRDLAAGGHVISRRSATLRNRREYFMPAMVRPAKRVSGGVPQNPSGGFPRTPQGGSPEPPY